jgi:hypothetical protein
VTAPLAGPIRIRINHREYRAYQYFKTPENLGTAIEIEGTAGSESFRSKLKKLEKKQ